MFSKKKKDDVFLYVSGELCETSKELLKDIFINYYRFSGEDIILSIIFSCSAFSFDVSISYSFSYNFCEIV